MKRLISRYLVTAALAGAVATAAIVSPTPANAQTDMSSILGAVISQVVTLFNNGNYNNNNNSNYSNWQYNQAQANTVVGRTNYGGVVYGDGRIVYNGQTYYSSNNGQTPCSFIANNAPRCSSNARGYRIAQNAPRPQWDNTQRNWNNGNNGNHYGNNGNHNGNNDNNGHHGDNQDNNGH